MVVITQKGRAAKLQKSPLIYRIIEAGVEKTLSQGKMKLTDDSVPPKTWWEAASNIGLFRVPKQSLIVPIERPLEGNGEFE